MAGAQVAGVLEKGMRQFAGPDVVVSPKIDAISDIGGLALVTTGSKTTFFPVGGFKYHDQFTDAVDLGKFESAKSRVEFWEGVLGQVVNLQDPTKKKSQVAAAVLSLLCLASQYDMDGLEEIVTKEKKKRKRC